MTVANDRFSNIVMPSLNGLEGLEREVYHSFIGHMRAVPTSKAEIKILSAIQFTADSLHLSDAHTSKVLVDMGLRAPRLSFPLEFLDYADGALMRCGWEIGAPSAGLLALRDYWFGLGEGLQPSSFRHIHAIIREDVSRI